MALRSRDRILLWILFLHVVKEAICAVDGPTEIKASVGEDALFMWNTTDNNHIKAVLWGIKSGTLADPQFINVNSYTRKVTLNTELGPRYKGRLHYFGNLSAGHAWFKLKNLTLNDTNVYIASITDHALNISPYCVPLIVTLKVKPTETITALFPNVTISTATSPTTTPITAAPTTTALTQTPSPLHWIIPVIVIGVVVMVVVIVIIFCYCCYKGMCKCCGCKIYWCKCCCCECCWCKSCMCVPFLCPKRKDEQDNKTDDNESGGVMLESASQEKWSPMVLSTNEGVPCCT